MASAHHINRHTTDLYALWYIITQSREIEKKGKDASQMKLPQLFNSFCYEERKREMKEEEEEKNTTFFFFLFFFIIEASNGKFEPLSFLWEDEKKEMEMPLLPQLLPQKMGFAYFVHCNK